VSTLMEAKLGATSDHVLSQLRLQIKRTSAASARQFVKVVFDAWSISGTDDAELLISELVTNVVKHVGNCPEPMRISILRIGDRIRIEVHDPSPEPPKPRLAKELDQSGYGLFLVQMIAADWGHTQIVNGKVVWFEVYA
jgi:anti-sigma regulatory factor (Ser/Thr protein kinase)